MHFFLTLTIENCGFLTVSVAIDRLSRIDSSNERSSITSIENESIASHL